MSMDAFIWIVVLPIVSGTMLTLLGMWLDRMFLSD